MNSQKDIEIRFLITDGCPGHGNPFGIRQCRGTDSFPLENSSLPPPHSQWLQPRPGVPIFLSPG